jgi:DNA replication protein DnaC
MEAIILKSATLRAKFDEYGHHVLEGGYVFDSENKSAVEEVIAKMESSRFGLTLMGNPGCGKTVTMEMLQKIIHPQSPQHFVRVNCMKLPDMFAADGHYIFGRWTKQHVLFDDLGTEEIGHHYKETLEIMEKFIHLRYELWRSHGIKTYLTTNLTDEEQISRYGLRCKSRMEEMNDQVKFKGGTKYTDRRSLRNFKGLPIVYHEPIISEAEKRFLEKIERSKHVTPESKQDFRGLGSMMKDKIGAHIESKFCDKCSGTGTIGEEFCDKCGGTGKVYL